MFYGEKLFYFEELKRKIFVLIEFGCYIVIMPIKGNFENKISMAELIIRNSFKFDNSLNSKKKRDNFRCNDEGNGPYA